MTALTSSGDLTINTDALFVDASAKSVGVGTASPANQFEVASASATKANFTHTSSIKTSLYIESDDTSARIGSTYYGSGGSFKPLTFLTSGLERMQIDSSGKIILPTGSPGIQFGSPDNPSASGSTDISSQTLDDYEEGSFTPALYLGSGTTAAALDWSYGEYTKIGNLVNIKGSLGVSGTVSAGSPDEVWLGQLPFTINQYNANNFVLVQISGYTWASGYGDSGSDTRLFIQNYGANVNKMRIYYGSGKAVATAAMIGTAQRFTFVLQYRN